MIITYRRKEVNRYHDEFIKIVTVEELENFLKNPPCPLLYKPNDFLKFESNSVDYIKSVVISNQKFDRTSLFEKFLFNVFKFRCKNQLGYWVSRGWSKMNAELKISEFQSKVGKSIMAKRMSSPDYAKTCNTKIEYWLAKGYSKTDAEKKLKERQSTFTLDKCITRYGKEQGKKRFDDRQKKWIQSLYEGLTEEERIEFERSKMSEIGKASKESLKVFLPVIQYFNLTNDEVYLGVDENKEYSLYCKETNGVFFYDFVIPLKKCIIEFNGTVWHPTGNDWKPLVFVTKSREELQKKQILKRDTAKLFGFKYLEIWDTDSVETNIQKCIAFLS